MVVGILTGGGDCPGLNAVIRAIVRVGSSRYGHTHVGLRNGWRGLLDQTIVPLDIDAVSGLLPRGGTILGTSRTNPFKDPEGGAQCAAGFRALGLTFVGVQTSRTCFLCKDGVCWCTCDERHCNWEPF